MGFVRRVFDAILEPAGTDKNIGLFRLFVFAAGLIILMMILFGVLQYFSTASSSDTFARLGQVGDYFGGTLNPLLTFLTFIGVLATIFLQREELKSTRDEIGRQADALETQLHAMAKQNFEATLFQSLALHNTIVEKINVTITRRSSSAAFKVDAKPGELIREKIEGRDALEIFAREVSEICSRKIIGKHTHDEKLSALREGYAEFWQSRRQNLGHYFRFLYNIIRLIEDSELANNRTYIRFVRAQLSDFETLLLLYNCLSEAGSNFKTLVEKHSLLDNLPEDFNVDTFLIEQFEPSAFRRAEEPKRNNIKQAGVIAP